MKGPPRAMKRYPGMYASTGNSAANANNRDPIAIEMAPSIPQTRGPYRSRIVPQGNATTLVDTAEIVNMRFNLEMILVLRATLERENATEALARSKHRLCS
jgi:hypothetical protein